MSSEPRLAPAPRMATNLATRRLWGYRLAEGGRRRHDACVDVRTGGVLTGWDGPTAKAANAGDAVASAFPLVVR